jgi:nitrogen-specific signal transduction histidine kinase
LVVTSEDSRIVFCNTAAQRLLGHDSRILIGMGLKELPLSSGVRQALIRRHQAVVGRRQAVEVRDQMLDTSGFRGRVDVYMRPLSTPPGPGVLIIFDPIRLVRPSRSNKLAKAASGGNSHQSRAVTATSGSKSGIHKGKSTRRAGNTNSKRRSRRRK